MNAKSRPLKSLSSFIDQAGQKPVERTQASTVPGRALEAAAVQKSELLQETEQLRTRVAEMETQRRVLEVDPTLIHRSEFANRDEINFQDSDVDFIELKTDIKLEGRNAVPVLLRPTADGRFEIVYGHRRVECCRQLGLKVQAIVESLDDRQLFIAMDKENRSRKNPSVLEQGKFYQLALKRGLYPSVRKMSEALGLDSGNVSKALAIAELPKDVIDAFASPLDIQYRHSTPLKEACKKDEARVIVIAKEVQMLSPRLSAGKVVARLMGEDGHSAAVFGADIEGLSVVKKDSAGRLTLRFAQVLPADKEDELLKTVAKILKS